MKEGWGEKYFWKWITENNHTKTFGTKRRIKFLTESEYRSISDMFHLDVFRRHFAKLAQSKILLRELTCNRKCDYVISSNEVCRSIPVTFSKFSWAKVRTEKLSIQDIMIKLCKKKYISRRVSRLVSTLSQLLHFWKPLQLISILLWGIPKWKRRVSRLPLKSKKLGFKDLFCLAKP